MCRQIVRHTETVVGASMVRWLPALFCIPFLAACCRGGGSEPETPTARATATATPTEPPPTPTPSPSPTPVPPPAVRFLTQGPYGNTVRELEVGATAAVELGPILPFIEAPLSPDGRYVAYAPPDPNPADIYLVDLDEGTTANLTGTPIEDDRAPWWSPSGMLTSLIRQGDQVSIRWEEPASGKATFAHTPLNGPVDLRWLPDESGFSFILNGGLYMLGVDAAGPVPVASLDGFTITAAAFAPGMRRIAVAVRSDESAAPEIAEGDDTAGQPSPPPPGAAEESQLLLLSPDGEEVAALAPGHTAISRLRWSPDGRYLAFVSTDEQGMPGLRVVEPGFEPELVYSGRVDDYAFNPAGTMMAIVADGGPCNGRTCPRGFLRVVDLQSGETWSLDDYRVLGRPAWTR